MAYDRERYLRRRDKVLRYMRTYRERKNDPDYGNEKWKELTRMEEEWLKERKENK